MPLKYTSFETGPLEANCIIVYDTETKEAVVFDPSGPTGIILTFATRSSIAIL